MPPIPQTTKPTANPRRPGNRIHTRKPAAASTPEATSAARREKRSASAPVGTSAAIPTADHSINSAAISASVSPVSAKSSA